MRYLLLGWLCFFVLSGALAQEAPGDPQLEAESGSQRDAPERVARLSYQDGEVVLAPAGTQEWTEALLNRPLTTGDRVWVDQGGRAELQLGSATIYLDQGSGFSFLDLDDDLLRMSLTDGAATIRIRRKLENETIEIATPNASVSLLHPGEYHIEVAEDGAATVVSTRSGESEVAGETDTFRVRANERGIFRGTDELKADLSQLPARTAFQDWANERERRDDGAVSSRYVSRDVIGYEDLDRNGEWISEPEYGHVWRPRYVAAGWAPYRFGRWVWVSPWGWNWVDNSAWGFAPFHYGRWAYVRQRWCWVPGPRHIRPVYAPALVGWVGGSGTSISVSFGSGVGWFPLGPREVYVPGYWHSRRYIHRVNVSNTYIVNNTYINNVYYGRGGRFDYRYGRMPGAVTLVSRDRFVGGRTLEGHVRPVSRHDVRRWSHDGRPPAITPTRNSVLASQPAGRQPTLRPLIRAEQLDAERANTQFLARRAPPARVPFDAERRAIEANQGRPVDRSRIISAGARTSRDRESIAGDSRGGARVRPEGAQPAPQAGFRSGGNAQRQLNDRPEWARQRRQGMDSRAQQSAPTRSSSERSPARTPEVSHHTLRPYRTAPPQQADARPEVREPGGEVRRPSDRSWASRSAAPQRDSSRSNSFQGNSSQPQRIERAAPRTYTPAPKVRSDRSAPSAREERAPSRSFTPSQPRAPAAQPRTRSEPRQSSHSSGRQGGGRSEQRSNSSSGGRWR